MLARDDDDAAAGKPACDYGDPAARDQLVDALAKDARALLAALDGQELGPVLAQAAALLATVTGQDLEQDASGVFRIARRLITDLLPGDPGSAASGPVSGTSSTAAGEDEDHPAVYGDAAYGSGELLGLLDGAGIRNGIKCQPPALAGAEDFRAHIAAGLGPFVVLLGENGTGKAQDGVNDWGRCRRRRSFCGSLC